MQLPDNEQEALQHIQRTWQERQQLDSLRPYAPHLNAYLQHQQKFQAWLAEQQVKQQEVQRADAEKPFWSEYFQAPEYNDAWKSQVIRDADGNLRAAPGAPPDVPMKLAAWESFQREQAAQLLKNPHEYIKPTVERLAGQIAEAKIKEHFARQNDVTLSKQFVDTNTNWLYELENGAPKVAQTYNPMNGQMESFKVLSPWGQAFGKYVQEFATMGLNVEQQKELALRSVQRDFAVWQLQNVAQGQQQQVPAAAPQATPQKPLSPQEKANQEFLARNNPGNPPSRGTAPVAETKVTRRNLRQAMEAAVRGTGATDQSIKN